MSAPEIDFMDADYTEVAYALMKTREELDEADATIHRYAEGLNAFLWELEKFPARHCAVLTPKMAQAMLDSIGIYAETGRKCEAVERALEEMGR